jgi:ABC-2 type transport system permease protein
MSWRMNGFGDAVRAEWIKLRSVRSTSLILLLAIGFGVGVGLLETSATVHAWVTMSAADRSGFDPVGDSFAGFQYTELAFGALGVLAISTEYGTGAIRASLRAVPNRSTLYAAKALVLGLLTLISCQASAFVAFLAGQRILNGRGLGVSLGDPGVLRAVLSAGVYMTVVTMVGFGLGAIIRHTAGALAALFALVFLAWPVARAVEGISYLPDRWLLVNAGDALATTHRAVGPHAARTPTPGGAAVVLVSYLVGFLVIGGWRVGQDA